MCFNAEKHGMNKSIVIVMTKHYAGTRDINEIDCKLIQRERN